MSNLKEHVHTILKPEDFRMIKNVLSRENLLAHSVARLYYAEEDTLKWIYSEIWGVVVLTEKDNCHYIQIIDLETNKIRFKHEVYRNFPYKTYLGFVHAWESEECSFALSFSDTKDSKVFKEKVESIIPYDKK
ncbi:neural wiskott-aldrich syndrome protein [Anaeramoeba flamelloides]|uniref:Neural wiskott-aldrich syndrome protein n=1 Tax=Anaeramoeba flamelloides TaxID=1746091 RepID=A0AAV7ZYQ5_9EUKA|nr:neural wiskott-aldrich syndrome protein [Anaeramoeba flamelloides]